MVSQQNTYLGKLQQKATENPKETLKHINTLVEQFPYFQALHHLRWDIARKHNLEDSPTLLKACSLRTKNRLHLIPNPDEAQLSTSTKQTHHRSGEVKSFTDWLFQLEPSLTRVNNQDRLIDKFISEAPKMSFEKTEEKQEDLTKKQSFDAQTLMTETLAEVYLKQGKLKKAKRAYEILALKYPEKSSFFANQIKEIKNTLKES
jgi:hypothetical protein